MGAVFSYDTRIKNTTVLQKRCQLSELWLKGLCRLGVASGSARTLSCGEEDAYGLDPLHVSAIPPTGLLNLVWDR